MNASSDLTLPVDLPGTASDQHRQLVELVVSLVRGRSPPPDPKYLTVDEAAAYCRVAVQTIYNNRRHIERMPGVRKLLFTREALDAWLARRRPRKRYRE